MKYIRKDSQVAVGDDGVLAPINNQVDATIYLTEDISEAAPFPRRHNFISVPPGTPQEGTQYLWLDETADHLTFRPEFSRANVAVHGMKVVEDKSDV